MIHKLIKAFGGKVYFIAFSCILLAAVILRFYQLGAFATFLGDQGRDVIIIKRLLTFENLPAIGPVTSVGQIYLGPFYYYFMAPWLLLFWFQPVGLAFGTAALSTLSIIAVYVCLKNLFNKRVALITSVLIAFSSILIEFARFSWNPNLLPFFAFFTFYFVYQSIQKKSLLYFALAGAFLSFCLQLHYLALFLIPATGVTYLLYLIENRKKIKQSLTHIFTAAGAFLLFMSPLFLFDIKHQFINLNSFLKLIGTSSTVNRNILAEASASFELLNKYLFNSSPQQPFAMLLFFAIVTFTIVGLTKKDPLRIMNIFFLFSLLGVALYSGPKYQHYLGTLYVFYTVILGYLLSYLAQNRVGLLLVFAFLSIYVYLNTSRYFFFRENPSNQIDRAQKISQVIYDQVSKPRFTVTMLPERSFDSPYRYFLEIWNRRPIEKDSMERADELFVVCEGPCKPIGDPQWDIAYFAPNKIVSIKEVVPGYTVYKLVR